MTKPDWPSIKCDYVETTMTLAEVQAKWDVRRGTLSARATRESWNDQKQQYAAKLEQTRREKNIAKAAEAQALFQSTVANVAKVQLALIGRQLQHQLQEKDVDVPKLLKLTNALATVQRIGFTALGIGPGDAGVAVTVHRSAN